MSAEAGWAGLPDARAVACFISAHGFGHATRAGAVMASLRERDPGLHFHLFTQAPRWVFEETLGSGFTHHAAVTDVGLAQATALVEDLPATLQRLDDFLPFDPHLVRHWADWLLRLECELVICDIAPLGLAVAQAAGLPSFLIENFTWDWIYLGYLEQAPDLGPHIDYLRDAFALAGHRLQTEPLCAVAPAAAARLAPIARRPRLGRAEVRAALGLAEHERMVLVTLGGLTTDLHFPAPSSALDAVAYVLPGAASELRRDGQRVLLPYQSGLFHPDLIAASDLVIGKVGYSTVAEAYHAGVPFGYVTRAHFRESPVMAEFVQREMQGLEIPAAAFAAGEWAEYVAALLQLPRVPAPRPNGADQAATWVQSRFLPVQSY